MFTPQFILKKRLELDFSRQDLSLKLGITIWLLKDIEQGKKPIPNELYQKFERLFNLKNVA